MAATIPQLPLELLDHIVDHLHDDNIALRALGLASKQTLDRSRSYLVSNLEFDPIDTHFDSFLALLDTPWTSFAFAVRSLHIKHLAKRHTPHPRSAKNFLRITANLPNLKALWLTSVSWDIIPPYMRDLFLQLNITSLQLDSVLLYRSKSNDSQFVEFLCKPSLQSISTYDFRCNQHHNLSGVSATGLQRPFHFETLDSPFLLLFNDVWDPTLNKNLNVTVESFHLIFHFLSAADKELHLPFISRFLRHVGKSLRRLVINNSCTFFRSQDLPYYESVDLSQCINVRVVHMGIIKLDYCGSNSTPRSSPMLLTMWKLLSNLPPNSVEEIFLTFSPDSVGELEGFAWLDLISRLQRMFSYLEKIVIRICACEDVEGLPRYVDVLRRREGVKQLEEEKVVSFQVVKSCTLGLRTFEPWREVDNF